MKIKKKNFSERNQRKSFINFVKLYKIKNFRALLRE